MVTLKPKSSSGALNQIAAIDNPQRMNTLLDLQGEEIVDHRILEADDSAHYVIDGNVFTAHELRGIILISEKDTPYHFWSFLKFWVYHLLQLLFSFAGLIPILIMECGNMNILYNMQFIGKVMGTPVQHMIAIFVLTANIFWIRLLYDSWEDPDNYKFNFFDHVYWITLIMVRAFVIATKYGIYSPEHFKMMENIKFNSYLL